MSIRILSLLPAFSCVSFCYVITIAGSVWIWRFTIRETWWSIFSTSASISISSYTRICICRSEFPLSHTQCCNAHFLFDRLTIVTGIWCAHIEKYNHAGEVLISTWVKNDSVCLLGKLKGIPRRLSTWSLLHEYVCRKELANHKTHHQRKSQVYAQQQALEWC